MESKILLESGNNELEVLEFKIDDHCYGINVAKIKEIIVYQECQTTIKYLVELK